MNLVRILCENAHNYNSHNHTEILTGVYYLADQCIEHIDAHGGRALWEKAWNEIKLIKEFSEEGLQSGDHATAFRKALDSSVRIGTSPPEDM
jgi:hypothetical protein